MQEHKTATRSRVRSNMEETGTLSKVEKLGKSNLKISFGFFSFTFREQYAINVHFFHEFAEFAALARACDNASSSI